MASAPRGSRPTPRSPWIGRAVWLVVLAALVGGSYAYWLRAKSKRAKVVKFETAVVDRGAITARIAATGTLSARKTVQVGSQVSGRIVEIFVDFNAEVKKGQIIAKLDPALFNASVQQARANLNAARADKQRAAALARDAAKQRDRLASLAARKLVAQAEADTADSNAQAAAAQVVSAGGEVERAAAALSQAELNLTYTTIVSPIDGVVISRDVDVGQIVAASLQAPTLFTIAEDLRKMQVHTNVSEGDVGRLEAGMLVTFTVDAYPQKKFKGAVQQIRNAPQTVSNVVTYDAVIDVDNPELELKPGMTANVAFVYGQRDDVLRVPNSALRFRAPPEWVERAKAGPEKFDGERGGAREIKGNGRELLAGDAGPPSRRERPERAPDRKTVWVVVEGADPRPVSIKTGLGDGTMTEVVEGELTEGDVLVTEVPGAQASPQGGAQGGGRRPRGPF